MNFGGLSVAQEVSLLSTASAVTGRNLTVTLGDNTKITFVGGAEMIAATLVRRGRPRIIVRGRP